MPIGGSTKGASNNDPVILRRPGSGRGRNEPGGSRQGLKLPVFLANHDDCAGAVVGESKGDRFRPAQACDVKQGDSGVVAESGRRSGGLRERMRRTQKARPPGICSPTTPFPREPMPAGGLTKRALEVDFPCERGREGAVKTPDGCGRIHLCPMIDMPVAGSPLQNRKHRAGRPCAMRGCSKPRASASRSCRLRGVH